MKWGCLLKQFAFIIVIIAVLHYIFAEKADEWFWQPIKQMVYDEIELKVDAMVDSLTYVAPNQAKEALIGYLYSIAENVELKETLKKDILNTDTFNRIINQYSADSLLTEEEIFHIKTEFQEILKNEKR